MSPGPTLPPGTASGILRFSSGKTKTCFPVSHKGLNLGLLSLFVRCCGLVLGAARGCLGGRHRPRLRPSLGSGLRSPQHPPPLAFLTAEAAVRGVRQAQAEDALRVDVDQLEKVLPQLVRERGSGRKWGCPAGWP